MSAAALVERRGGDAVTGQLPRRRHEQRQSSRIFGHRDRLRPEADDRGRLRPCPGARRDFRLQAGDVRPQLFLPEGRSGRARCRVLEGHGPAAELHAGGWAGGRLHRHVDHLSRALALPAGRRAYGAGRRRRLDGAARGAQAPAGRRGPVRCRPQAAAALPAHGGRCRHLADRGGHPRHPAPPGGPVPLPRDRLAGRRAGRGCGPAGGRRHRRFRRPARRRRAAATRAADRRTGWRQHRGSLGLQRGDRAAGGGALPDPADLGGRARDRYDADRPRGRPPGTDADRGRGNGGAGAPGSGAAARRRSAARRSGSRQAARRPAATSGRPRPRLDRAAPGGGARNAARRRFWRAAVSSRPGTVGNAGRSPGPRAGGPAPAGAIGARAGPAA